MLEFFFWFFISLILYSYFGYPIILLVLGLFFGKKPRTSDDFLPEVSLLVPVYNEEKIIAKKIENCLELDYPKERMETVVASESNDGTNEIVGKYKDKGIKLFSFPERKGKQNTIYRILPLCQGEIIILTDANAFFKKNALKKLVRNFADPKIGCVSGRLEYQNPGKSPAGKGEETYWDYENIVRKLESRMFSLLGANGSIYALRKNLYSPINQFRGDDFDLPLRIRLQKKGVIWEKDAVSEEEVYPETKKEFARKTVIVAWHFRGALMLIAESLRKGQLFLVFQLVSHKLLRWLAGFFLAAIYILNIFLFSGGPLFAVLFLLQNIFYLSALAGFLLENKNKKPNRLINLIYYYCAVNAASFVGVLKGIFNLQKPTWEKAR